MLSIKDTLYHSKNYTLDIPEYDSENKNPTLQEYQHLASKLVQIFIDSTAPDRKDQLIPKAGIIEEVMKFFSDTEKKNNKENYALLSTLTQEIQLLSHHKYYKEIIITDIITIIRVSGMVSDQKNFLSHLQFWRKNILALLDSPIHQTYSQIIIEMYNDIKIHLMKSMLKQKALTPIKTYALFSLTNLILQETFKHINIASISIEDKLTFYELQSSQEIISKFKEIADNKFTAHTFFYMLLKNLQKTLSPELEQLSQINKENLVPLSIDDMTQKTKTLLQTIIPLLELTKNKLSFDHEKRTLMVNLPLSQDNIIEWCSSELTSIEGSQYCTLQNWRLQFLKTITDSFIEEPNEIILCKKNINGQTVHLVLKNESLYEIQKEVVIQPKKYKTIGVKTKLITYFINEAFTYDYFIQLGELISQLPNLHKQQILAQLLISDNTNTKDIINILSVFEQYNALFNCADYISVPELHLSWDTKTILDERTIRLFIESGLIHHVSEQNKKFFISCIQVNKNMPISIKEWVLKNYLFFDPHAIESLIINTKNLQTKNIISLLKYAILHDLQTAFIFLIQHIESLTLHSDDNDQMIIFNDLYIYIQNSMTILNKKTKEQESLITLLNNNSLFLFRFIEFFIVQTLRSDDSYTKFTKENQFFSQPFFQKVFIILSTKLQKITKEDIEKLPELEKKRIKEIKFFLFTHQKKQMDTQTQIKTINDYLDNQKNTAIKNNMLIYWFQNNECDDKALEEIHFNLTILQQIIDANPLPNLFFQEYIKQKYTRLIQEFKQTITSIYRNSDQIGLMNLFNSKLLQEKHTLIKDLLLEHLPHIPTYSAKDMLAILMLYFEEYDIYSYLITQKEKIQQDFDNNQNDILKSHTLLQPNTAERLILNKAITLTINMISYIVDENIKEDYFLNMYFFLLCTYKDKNDLLKDNLAFERDIYELLQLHENSTETIDESKLKYFKLLQHIYNKKLLMYCDQNDIIEILTQNYLNFFDKEIVLKQYHHLHLCNETLQEKLYHYSQITVEAMQLSVDFMIAHKQITKIKTLLLLPHIKQDVIKYINNLIDNKDKKIDDDIKMELRLLV